MGESIGLPSEWTCYLSNNGNNGSNANNNQDKKWIQIWVLLDKAPEDVTELIASCQVEIKKTNYKSSFTENFLTNEMRLYWGWTEVIDRNSTNNPGNLDIDVTITLMSQQPRIYTLGKVGGDIEKEFEIRFAKKLQEDLATLLCMDPQQNSEESSETKIVSQDFVQFSVNPGILAARSPEFARILQGNTTEAKSGLIIMDDISSRTMAVLLNFIYTGMLHEDWKDKDVIPELVYASNKCQLKDLFEFLDQIIGRVCCKENVGKLIRLAKQLSMKEAEKDLVEFMKKHMSTLEDILAFADSSTRLKDDNMS